MRLAGRKAVITGAGGATGKVFAPVRAREGCDVAGLDVAAEGLELFGAGVRETGREALELKADITDLDAIQSAIDEVVRAWDGIDILVNNAGGGMVRPFHEMTAAEWQRMVEVN